MSKAGWEAIKPVVDEYLKMRSASDIKDTSNVFAERSIRLSVLASALDTLEEARVLGIPASTDAYEASCRCFVRYLREEGYEPKPLGDYKTSKTSKVVVVSPTTTTLDSVNPQGALRIVRKRARSAPPSVEPVNPTLYGFDLDTVLREGDAIRRFARRTGKDKIHRHDYMQGCMVGAVCRALSADPEKVGQLPADQISSLYAQVTGSEIHPDRWILSGDTRPHKDMIKGIGGKWNYHEKFWVVPGDALRRNTRERLEASGVIVTPL